MADNERQLTEKQRAFVEFYLGECNFNATKAAERAGYSSYKQSGTECLANPLIRKEIDSYFDKLKNEGLRSKNVRVKALTETAERLDNIVAANAQEAREAMETGERVPMAALEGFHIKDVKISANGKTVTQWILDKNLMAERRATLDQIAKELNDYVTRSEVSGPDGGPIQLDVAQAAYDALLNELSV